VGAGGGRWGQVGYVLSFLFIFVQKKRECAKLVGTVERSLDLEGRWVRRDKRTDNKRVGE
jgi:hypothetical protein